MVHIVLLVILIAIVILPPLIFFGYMYTLSKKPKVSIQ